MPTWATGVDKYNSDIEIKHRGKDKRLTDEERRLLKPRDRADHRAPKS
ncbi:hypothetical protein [Limnohabitans sp. 2KL-17]|nr:hypothetical protein [Limnohabitans sp. 2KL-17]